MKKPQTIMYKILVFFVFIVSLSAIKAQTTVFNENFEGTLQVTPTGVPAWSINTTLQVSGTNSYHNVVGLNSTTYFETNTINLTGYNFVLFDFRQICKIEFADSARLFYSTNNGATWQLIPQSAYLGSGVYFTNNMVGFTSASYPATWQPGIPGALPDNTWWKYEQFNVSALVGNQAQVKFRFYLKDGNGNGANTNAGWYIDDIRVIASPYELIPPVITLVQPILQDTVYSPGPFNVNAIITDASGISSAKLFYKINANPWDSVVMNNTSGNNYLGVIPSQPYNTNIQYYVKAVDASLSYNTAQTAIISFINKKPAPVFTIGTGTSTNTTTSYPTPYGTYYKNHRVQYLIRASELNALGVPPGPFTSIAFEVVALNNCVAMPNFTIKMKHTTQSQLTTTFEPGTYTTLWTHPNFLPVVGWNQHIFTTPFFWDGTSNIIVDICFDLIPGNFTQNASVTFTPTTGVNTTLHFNSDSSPACTATTGTVGVNRANMRITTPPNNNDYDAGIVQISEPSGIVLTTSPQDVKVRFKNYGIQTLTSLNIGWSLNGTPQTPYSWTGTLLEDVTSNITTIGSATFNLGNNTLKVWTSQPNNQPDQNTLNDTMSVVVFGCANFLNGTYTINSSLPSGGNNFQSFDEAMQALTNCGINGPVVFNVAPGTYNTRLVFNSVIPGSSPVNTVTFNGTGNVIINHTTTVSDQRAAILIDGAKYLRFNNLTVNIPPSSTFGVGFQFINNAEDIQIKNCTINVDQSSTSTNYSGIVASGSLTSPTTLGNSAHNILIENNTVNGGYYGIIFYGNTTTPLNSIIIRGNIVNNSYYYGIRTQYTNSVLIEGNKINMRVTGGTTFNYALYLAYEYQTFRILRNDMVNSGQYGIYITNATPSSGRSLIANNSIGGFTNTGTPYGIYLTTCANIDIYHNSVNVGGATGRGIHTLATAVGLRVVNNSFAFTGTGAGYAVYHTSMASIQEHNFNNYYSTGTTFVFYGASQPDLAALQAVNVPPGNDLNSLSGNPQYISSTILLPIGSLLNDAGTPLADVPVDILNNPRDPSTPDIGAYEFTPISADIALLEAKLVHGPCITNNDSLRVKVLNVTGNTVDFSVDPLDVKYIITGPVNSNGSFSINNGTLAVGNDLTITFVGVDMSMPGTYNLKAFISTNAVNLLTINDTLNNAHTLTINPEIFDAQPNTALITTPIQTVPLTVSSNVFPPGQFFFTEVCYFKTTVGQPISGWPTYLIADDYIEITGVPNSDLAGYKLEIWNTSGIVTNFTFPAGTILSPQGTAIIAIGQLGSSTPSPANFYYHAVPTSPPSFSSSDLTGLILKNPSNNIIDAVATNGFTFPAASGVTAMDWSGNVPSSTSTSGIRLNGPDINSAANWVVSSATFPQNPNQVNNNVTVPTAQGLTGFSWSLNGVITSVNSIDTIVGPWTVNGYYPYVATYTNVCGTYTDTVHITVFIPTQDLSVQQIITPGTDECYYQSEIVSVKIANLGTDPVPANTYSVSFQVGNAAPVTETGTQTVQPGQFVIHTFTNPLILNFSGMDTIVTLKAYTTLGVDPFPNNDTLSGLFKFNYTPNPPVTSNVNIPYGTSATLTASSPVTIFWYNSPSAINFIDTGSTFVTPILYNSTSYYVGAATYADGLVQLGNGTLTNAYVPCYGFYDYSWSSTLYLPSELGFSGKIDTLMYFVNNTVSSYLMNNQRIYMANVPYTTFPDASYIGVSNLTQVFNGNITWTGPGWNKIPLSTPFYYDGTSTLLIHFENWDGSWTSGYPSFAATTVPANMVKYQYTDGSFPTSSGTFVTTRPNTRFSYEKKGCESDRVEVVVTVTNAPAIDVGPTALVSPVSGFNLGNQIVRVKVKNYGTTPVSNIPVSYKVNTANPVTETITATIQPGDEYVYQFATPYIFGAFGPYQFKVYTSLATDPITVNDTLLATVNNNQLIYCASGATSNTYGDIGNVTISNLNNGVASPIMGNPNATGTYSDFTLTVPPVELAQGMTYPMSVTVISQSTYYYTYYVKAFIDYDQDGVFDPVNELILEGVTVSDTQTEITGNVTVPLTALSGYTRMRIVCVETSNPAMVQPCGTYTWGETEDYSVLIAPQLAQDGGVIAIIEPNGIFSEGDVVNVTISVKNFGTDTLFTIPVSYQHNANPPVLQTWNGALAPNQTVQISMPQLTVASGINNICAKTEIIDDTNTFNDQTCSSFWGLPGQIIFSDSFEGGSLFTPAPNDTVWQLGIPAGVVINSAYDGDSCWVTILDGQYPAMAMAYLVSPTLNFTGINGAYLSLAYWMDGEPNSDGGYVQYSTNNGISWTTLGVINDTEGYNWYDSFVGTQPGWSTATNGWKPAFISLAPLNNAGPNVKLRFVFRSNASIENEGFAIDAVKIHAPFIATDAGVVEIISPSGQSATGSPNQVTVKIKNFGTAPLTSIPVSYKLYPGPQETNATWTGNLAPGAETTFTFPQTFLGPFNPFTLCAYTTLGGDVYKFNDTTCLAITPGQATIDGGVVDIIAPTVLPGAGQQVQVTIKIENFGTAALTNFPVQYFVNGTIQTSEVVQTTLPSGATMNYTFITQFTSQGTDVQICAKTAIPSDAISANDQFCKDVQVGINEQGINGVMLYQNIPNPADESTIIGFTIPTAGKVLFTVNNILGQTIISETSEFAAGTHTFELNLKNFAPGIYYYSIVFDQIKLTKKMNVR